MSGLSFNITAGLRSIIVLEGFLFVPTLLFVAESVIAINRALT